MVRDCCPKKSFSLGRFELYEVGNMEEIGEGAGWKNDQFGVAAVACPVCESCLSWGAG